MYSAILLNFIVVLCFYGKYRGNATILLAMAITVIADYYLTYENSNFLRGVVCFCLVQMIYGWKLTYHKKNLIFRIVTAILLAGILIALGMNQYDGIFCGISMGFLLGNVLVSYKRWGESQKRIDFIFFIGLILFMGCDLSLGLRIISESNKNMKLFHDIMNYMTWTCYLPSQVLLNCSYIIEAKAENRNL